MKIYETKPVPATTREILVKRKCDLCGVESKKSDWGAGVYEINETEIKITIKRQAGSNFPECGRVEEYETDLCPDCFKSRLVPWLRSQGANIEEQELDW